MVRRTHKARKREFAGWGSKELISFLTSIDKCPDEPISKDEVYGIIKSYIQDNRLIHPQRKKKVICDLRLKSLFGRKSVNRLQISNYLEEHFAENQVSEDDSLYGSEEEKVPMSWKQQRKSSCDKKTHRSDFMGKGTEALRTCYASIIAKNIKLVYLRRSLVEKFLKTPETFESKVLDSFVRVKSDPNDYYLPKTFFQLVQVTGIEMVSATYKTGEVTTDVVLRAANRMKDICICMLSDDDFTEEECEELHLQVKKGLVKRPTVLELDRKARSLHEDITNHWIDREIVVLQNRIDRANEKGWRRENGSTYKQKLKQLLKPNSSWELFEYIERREKLQTPSERLRLLEELPKVTADAEELEGTPNSPKDSKVLNEENGECADYIDTDMENQENGECADDIDTDMENQGNWTLQKATNGGAKDFELFSFGNQTPSKREKSEIRAEDIGTAFLDASPHENGKTSFFDHGNGADLNQTSGRQDTNGNVTLSTKKVGMAGTDESRSSIFSFFFGNGSTPDVKVGKNKAEEDSSQEKYGTNGMRGVESVIPVIDLDDDSDDNDENPIDASVVVGKEDFTTVDKLVSSEEGGKQESSPEATAVPFDEERKQESSQEKRRMWHYTDPNGEIQGPVSMLELRYWKELGYFDECSDFKVWVTGQSPQDAILLTDAISITASKI